MSQVYSIAETTNDKENKSATQFDENRVDKVESANLDQTILNKSNNLAQDDSSDEGWQEAIPKGRSLAGRKSSSSRRPTLAKLNTNFMNVSQSSRYRGKPTNFSSPRTNLNETIGSSGPSLPITKKFNKSASFSPKLNSANTQAAGPEKLADSKSAPVSPAPGDQISKYAPASSSISVQSAGKLFSYKEVALAPPGTVVKAVAEQSPKGSPIVQQNPEMSQDTVATKETHSNVATIKDVEDSVQKPIDEIQLNSVHDEQKEKEAAVVTDNTETIKTNDQEVVEVKPKEVNNDAAAVEVENSDLLHHISNSASEGASEIEVQESCQATYPDLNPLTILSEDEKQLLENDASVSKEKVTEGDEKQHELPSGNTDSKALPSEREKQDEIETVKETTKKLSAAAPPFNPSTIPVFGSVPVPVPGFKDHVGILPPPVNISPMLAVNPRRSPHQSATARVPYGPRISGNYNRYGNRVPRSKTVFHSGEKSTDGNPNSPPRIMNPHATEFVPGQTWVPNGYPVPPNEYIASPNDIPVSPNSFSSVSPSGVPVSPSGYPASIPVDQNGVATPPTSSTDSAQVVFVETNLESKNEALDEENIDAASMVISFEKQKVEQNPQDHLPATNENCPKIEEKPADLSPTAGSSQDDNVTSKDTEDEKKPSKCWGDYSDSEADMIEVTS